MPLTNAEKQRRYREKLKNDPVKKEEIRKKNLEIIKRNTNKIQDMTDEEKNDKRKMWSATEMWSLNNKSFHRVLVTNNVAKIFEDENNVVHTEFLSESSHPDNYGYVEVDQASNQGDHETICVNDNESILSIDTSTILNNLDESDVFKNLQHLKGPIDLQLSPLINATTSEDEVTFTSPGTVKTVARSPTVKLLSDVTLSWENAKFYRKTKIPNENRNPNQLIVAHNNSKHQQQLQTLIQANQSEKQTKKYNYLEDSDDSDEFFFLNRL